MADQREIIATFLGYYLDGWADLIEGMGGRADEVRKNVYNQLNERKSPNIKIENAYIKPDLFSALVQTNPNKYNGRGYVVTSTFPGATTIISIESHGIDLYTSWRTYVHPPLNWVFLVSSILIAFVGGLLLAWFGFFKDFNELLRSIRASNDWESYSFTISNLFGASLGLFLFGVMISVALFKDRKKTRIFTCILIFTIGVGSCLMGGCLAKVANSEVYQVYSEGYSNISNRFSDAALHYNMIIFSVIFFVAALWGLLESKNLFYFFITRSNLFQAEDITAMSLAVHKTILRSLDLSGIDISRLRLKREFKGGRRNEAV